MNSQNLYLRSNFYLKNNDLMYFFLRNYEYYIMIFNHNQDKLFLKLLDKIKL
jgi:hypothetical protein